MFRSNLELSVMAAIMQLLERPLFPLELHPLLSGCIHY